MRRKSAEYVDTGCFIEVLCTGKYGVTGVSFCMRELALGWDTKFA